MATFRKRQLKSGVVYDIQVKFREPNTNQTIVKTTVWHPEYKMTDRQAERECALVAQKFENDVKQLYTGSVADVPDYNITVGQMADKWLERVHKDFSIAYYERGIKTVEWIKRYIQGYRMYLNKLRYMNKPINALIAFMQYFILTRQKELK